LLLLRLFGVLTYIERAQFVRRDGPWIDSLNFDIARH
jgi:hypothetical protein